MVMLPFAVAFAAALPHEGALHETDQVSAFPDVSPVTVAATPITPAAIPELAAADTVTVITGGGGVTIGELPPQPVMLIAKAKPRNVYAKETVRSICPPCIWLRNGHGRNTRSRS